MSNKVVIILLAAAACVLASSFARALPAQQSPNSQSTPTQAHDSMAGMEMGQRDSEKNSDATRAANDAMSDHDMDMSMSAHMYMTTLRRESRR